MNSFNYDQSKLQKISDIVYKTSGIIFKDSNLSVLSSKLSIKLKEKKIDVDEYIDLLIKDKNELMEFVDFVTTNFTSFFRHNAQFELLEKELLPELIEKNKDSKFINCWSAGCATGEEPYTIMMVLHNFLENNSFLQNGWNFKVIGSDISLESLFIAKDGKFPERSLKKVKDEYLSKYFVKLADKYSIKEDYKKYVQFDYHNLIYDNGIRNMDFVYCRNVLIYFDEDIQKKVLDNIYLSLKPNGYLFIGHSESLIGLYNNFKPVSKNNGIVYVKQ